jgi:hypothetical protein
MKKTVAILLSLMLCLVAFGAWRKTPTVRSSSA